MPRRSLVEQMPVEVGLMEYQQTHLLLHLAKLLLLLAALEINTEAREHFQEGRAHLWEDRVQVHLPLLHPLK